MYIDQAKPLMEQNKIQLLDIDAIGILKEHVYIHHNNRDNHNKTSHPISSNSHPSATAIKGIHCLKWGGGEAVDKVWSCALDGRFGK